MCIRDRVTRVYDVVRNYAFNITVKSVSRKGATWAEVIDENAIADNNITASAIMEKYPNITYDGEALNLSLIHILRLSLLLARILRLIYPLFPKSPIIDGYCLSLLS